VILCSDKSVNFVGMQYITAKVNTTDNSIIETKISEPAGYVK